MKQMSPTLVLLAFSALIGVVSGAGHAQFNIGGGYSMGEVGDALYLSIATFMWCREDSWRRSYIRSNGFYISFVGLTMLVLPYYLVKTRGLGRGLVAIGVALLIYVVYVICVGVGVLFIRLLKV